VPAARKSGSGSEKGARYVVGVDLGGTNIVFGAMTVDGARQFAMHAVPTHAELGADGVVGRIVEGIERVIADTRATTGATRDAFAGVGIGSPGPLDRERGTRGKSRHPRFGVTITIPRSRSRGSSG
jgi:predicted NBD/HSP70 family sugar kinase